LKFILNSSKRRRTPLNRNEKSFKTKSENRKKSSDERKKKS